MGLQPNPTTPSGIASVGASLDLRFSNLVRKYDALMTDIQTKSAFELLEGLHGNGHLCAMPLITVSRGCVVCRAAACYGGDGQHAAETRARPPLSWGWACAQRHLGCRPRAPASYLRPRNHMERHSPADAQESPPDQRPGPSPAARRASCQRELLLPPGCPAGCGSCPASFHARVSCVGLCRSAGAVCLDLLS